MNMEQSVPENFPVHKACWVKPSDKSDEFKEFRQIKQILSSTNMASWYFLLTLILPFK
jgi:hypothetical protein